MARNITALLLLLAYGSCMEMRETVERMVMVRTTGSDLQPAATGYIYKKESDGPESVIKMGPSEVIEHFHKLYGKPEAYKAAPTDSEAKTEDEDKAASYANEEHVIPVVEAQNEEHIDGLANEDYHKMFEDYAKQFGTYRSDFSGYLHGLKDDHLDTYHLFGDEEDFGARPHDRYAEKSNLEYGEPYKDGIDEYKDDDKHHDKGEKIDRFQRGFNKDNIEKEYGLYGRAPYKNRLYAYAIGHGDHGDARGYQKGSSYDSEHHDGGEDKEEDSDNVGHASERGETGHVPHGGFGITDEHHSIKSYRYEINH